MEGSQIFLGAYDLVKEDIYIQSISLKVILAYSVTYSFKSSE
jgi:hypothetical protein